MSITLSRSGMANGSGDAKALFLIEFGGLILNLFQDKTMLRSMHTVVPLRGAKSFDFPIYGRITGGYHTPGTELSGREIKHGNRNIGVDPLLTTDAIIDNLDAVLNYWEVRSAYADEMAFFLAKAFDNHCFAEILKGAQAVAGTNTDFGSAFSESLAGYVIKNADLASGTVATALAAFIKSLALAAKNFDEKNIPMDGRRCIIKPDLYWNLVSAATTLANSGIINKDVGGSGAVSTGALGPIMGFEILTSNLIPYANYKSLTPTVANPLYEYHQVDAADTMGVCFHPSAIGSVAAIDMNVDVFERKELRAWHMVAEYAMGHGVLRPEACVELSKASS